MNYVTLSARRELMDFMTPGHKEKSIEHIEVRPNHGSSDGRVDD